MKPEQIKKARELLGLSLAGLGKAMGSGKQQVFDWERGRFRPSKENQEILRGLLESRAKEIASLLENSR